VGHFVEVAHSRIGYGKSHLFLGLQLPPPVITEGDDLLSGWVGKWTDDTQIKYQ